jgi:hypothetical protein
VTTLRDALTEALGKSEAGTLETPQETPIESPAQEVVTETQEQKEARARDEQGRFTKVEAKEGKEPVQQPEPTGQTQATTRKPPSSWKKDYWGHWERLGTDPELAKLQDYIEQREADYAKGVSTYKSQWDQAAPVYEAIQPFMPELQQYGIQPGQWIQNLGNAHRTLALGSPEQKLQMFAKLAMDYGVPLQALQTGQIDPQAGQLINEVSTLKREWESEKQRRLEAEQAAIYQQIDAFAKTHPLFEKAKPYMGPLIQSGMATDLETAYQKAIRLDDDLWREHQAQQAKEAEAERQAEIARKKAAAVSPKSSSPTGAMTAGGNTKKGLREQLSEAVDSIAGGRF